MLFNDLRIELIILKHHGYLNYIIRQLPTIAH